MDTPTSKSKTFFDLPPDCGSDPASRYAVLPIPYERTTSYRAGTQNGPAAILDASTQVDEFDDELRIPFALRVQTLDAPDMEAASIEESLDSIRAAALSAAGSDRFLLSLGGEHSITAPIVSALRETREVRTVVQLDAHCDLRNEYQSTPHSHACVMRRIRDAGLRTVHVGCRSLCEEEADLIHTEEIPVFWGRELAAGSFDLERLDAAIEGPVYLTVDIDAFDPAEAPGTGTPEPGGLSWYSLNAIVKHLMTRHPVVSADIVEVSPLGDSVVTEFLAARLAVKMLLYHSLRSD